MAEDIFNRLGDCTSPYLLQHATNPVAWQPWDEQAIELAKKLDRPLLVSIGYAACHWCHVMEHESFDDEEIAAMMNQSFVCIKVDREERPDVDALYMTACQITTGAGGWPLNVFVEPNTLKPFYAGTYYPPQSRYGRLSWRQLLEGVTSAWQHQRQEILDSSQVITEQIQRSASGAASSQDVETLVEQAIPAAVNHSKNNYDHVNGGIGGAPKFPHPMEMDALLRAGEYDHVALSLDLMASRGLFDHLAGGWHRYCVDAGWAVPHFEKMLYDNALMLALHEKARRRGVGSHNDRVIRLTLEWLANEMLDPDGGVWSTLDADSLGEDGKSEEGEFYLWRPEQAEDMLACERFGITEQGNFEVSGRSVLSLHEVDGLEDDEDLRHHLLNKRSHRPRPGTDDKVLTAWNGMLLVACAELPEDEAKRIGQHICKELLAREEVIRTRRGDSLGGPGFLDDYAWSALGLLRWGIRWDDEQCQHKSLEITGRLLEIFTDPDGGFWMTSAAHTELPVRQKSVSDSAVPGASAVVVELLRTLLLLWPDHSRADEWRQAGEKAILALGDDLVTRAGGHQAMVSAAQGLVEPGQVWFIHHSGTAPDEVESLRRAADWNQIVVSSSSPIGDKQRGEDEWMGWLCEGMTCRPATTNADDLIWKATGEFTK
jgi:uncharacterized protein YyaL (SSP411 family)